MKTVLLLLVIIFGSSFLLSANNPLKPLIKTDTISYIQCYTIRPYSNGVYAPFTFFKIKNNYYEGVAFPFWNSDCIENYTETRDSFAVDYQSTIDTIGERKVYNLAKEMGIGDHYENLKNQNFPDLLECIKRNALQDETFQFIEIRFIAQYYLIRCDKPRNCYGPDYISDRLIDNNRTPIFTKIELILQ